ncbi:MAG: N-acetylglucosamine-6-phosphate deacetylase [Clostridiales bacterium]|nr:N-acetylglucosamine-6-phosphate deacetylase [Clostridiales bacterium]MBR4818912.1 N-acetylglucosamine-6-phosphate deacetylase [Clostridiales bacterium]
MRLNHVDLVDATFSLQKDMTMTVDNGRISAIGKEILSVPADEEEYDLSGMILIPGFIDLHIHGAMGADTSDGTVEALSKISSYLVSKGVTSFCPTTMMIPEEDVKRVLLSADHFKREETGSRVLGVRLEGPFLSKEKCGVQNTDHAMDPNTEYVKEILSGFSEDLISIIDIAPELSGSLNFITEMKEKYVLSCAHTASAYQTCREAIKAGLHHATHLFNAMNPLGHHEPGAPGALLEDKDVTCELICDGLHVHPALLKIAFTVLGEDRAVVVSDAMRAAGMPDGIYDLGGKAVNVVNGKTDFGDGRLAGSTTDIHAEFLNLLKIGIPMRTALKACTLNPAKVLKIDGDTGTLEIGKYADMVALDKNNNVRKVWVKGKLVFSSDEGKE